MGNSNMQAQRPLSPHLQIYRPMLTMMMSIAHRTSGVGNAVGKCEPPDFKSAGPHFNPDDTKHGLMNAEGPHAGDMPNLHVPDSGKLTVEVLNEMVTLDAEPALLDDDGSAIVVHAVADDYQTDPAGNAGDRIACGVVTE